MLIDFSYLVRKHGVKASSVLHLGAHEGQEAATYHSLGYRMSFVEANPEIFERLKRNVTGMNATCYNKCVSDTEEEVTFNLSSNDGQSSSLLELGTHAHHHPDVTFTGSLTLQTERVDSFIKDKHDLLVMDLQGAELKALRGMGKLLDSVKYIYTEVNAEEVYKGCVKLNELDEYLCGLGFVRTDVKMTPWKWGDAFYVKKKSKLKHPELAQFQLDQPNNYPGHSKVDFEQYFLSKYRKSKITYLPILWTSFYRVHDQDAERMAQLQYYLDSLDTSQEYFTIIQHDDGIKHRLPPNTKVFGMSKGFTYPLPLICEPHRHVFDEPKNLEVFFAGYSTHHIRRRIVKRPGWDVSLRGKDEKEFCRQMARAVFALCPRGYGPTSFRIMEALQYGAIPVYISDTFVIPHNIPFDQYGLLVPASEIRRLPQILEAVTPERREELRAKGAEIYKKYFTYQANFKIIMDHVR